MPCCDLCKSGADLEHPAFTINKNPSHSYEGFILHGFNKIEGDRYSLSKVFLCEDCRNVLGKVLHRLINPNENIPN